MHKFKTDNFHEQALQAAIDADIPSISEEDSIRYLHFDSQWIQGAMNMARPSELVLGYTQQMMAWLLFMRPGKHDSIGILGLGAGSLLRFCLRHTRAKLITIERNPRVTAICEAFFRLATNARSEIIHMDASAWVADPDNQASLTALMVDLYDKHAQGPVCGDLQFYSDCYKCLASPGVLSVNLFGNHSSFEDNLQALHQAFAGNLLALPETDAGNTIVFGFKGCSPALDYEQIYERARFLQERMGLPALRWVKSMHRPTLI